MKTTSPRQKIKIEQAAELYFNGHSQDEIAERLGLTQGRVSQMQAHPDWSETIERLESLRERVQAELVQQHRQEYNDELQAWLENSKAACEASFSTAEKLLQIANDAVETAMGEPDKIAATNKLKNVYNLVRAAVALREQADSAMNTRLGLSEVAKHFEQN